MPPRQAAAAPHRARYADDAFVRLVCAGLLTMTMVTHPSAAGRAGRSTERVYSLNLVEVEWNSRKFISRKLHSLRSYRAKKCRYPRTDTGNRSPHLVPLNRDAPQ